jgi:hypothetical protein
MVQKKLINKLKKFQSSTGDSSVHGAIKIYLSILMVPTAYTGWIFETALFFNTFWQTSTLERFLWQ